MPVEEPVGVLGVLIVSAVVGGGVVEGVDIGSLGIAMASTTKMPMTEATIIPISFFLLIPLSLQQLL